jgi:hypothetical protein
MRLIVFLSLACAAIAGCSYHHETVVEKPAPAPATAIVVTNPPPPPATVVVPSD